MFDVLLRHVAAVREAVADARLGLPLRRTLPAGALARVGGGKTLRGRRQRPQPLLPLPPLLRGVGRRRPAGAEWPRRHRAQGGAPLPPLPQGVALARQSHKSLKKNAVQVG